MGRKSSKKRAKRSNDAGADVSALGYEASPASAVSLSVKQTDSAVCTHKRARVEPPPAEIAAAEVDDEAGNSPLATAEVAQFERDGFILLRDAFSPDTARACRELLWTRLAHEGIQREDKRSWVERIGIPECYTEEDAPVWGQVVTRRLRLAMDQLCGVGRYEDFGLGWWMVTFPGQSTPPWGPAGKWHVDGAGYQHRLTSRESGLLAIFLFSDIGPGEGGTALATGSHQHVARLVGAHEPRGLKGGAVSFHTRELLAQQLEGDAVVEVNGRAGDVMLVHPFLLHARSKNLGLRGVDSVRFMCNPNVRLRREMDLSRPEGELSAVERSIRRALDDPEQ